METDKKQTWLKVFGTLIVSALPITQIILGVKYLHECQIEQNIPIYLIVSGIFTIIFFFLPFLSSKTKCPRLNRINIAFGSLVSMFLFGWFIMGNIWVYSVYKPYFDKNATHVSLYCDKTLYLFAFWTITINYIMLGVLFIVFCCIAAHISVG